MGEVCCHVNNSIRSSQPAPVQTFADAVASGVGSWLHFEFDFGEPLDGRESLEDLRRVALDIQQQRRALPKYATRAQLVKCPGHNLMSAKTYQEFTEKLPRETAIPPHIMDPKDSNTVYKVIE